MLNNVPGCFSIPSVFAFESPVCKACPQLPACQKECKSRLEAAKFKTVLLERLIKSHEVFERNNEGVDAGKMNFATVHEVEPDQEDKLKTMPASARRYYQTLIRKGIVEEVRKAKIEMFKRNPFPEFGDKSAHIAARVLVDEGGFNRIQLTKAIVKETGWARNSAAARAAILWHCFLALELIEEVPGKDWAVLHPSIRGQNNRSIN